MIRVIVMRPPQHPIIVSGDMRSVSITTEKLLRRSHEARIAVMLDVEGQEGEEADVDNVRQYLAGLGHEIECDDLLRPMPKIFQRERGQ